jgi:hypothetical protein
MYHYFNFINGAFEIVNFVGPHSNFVKICANKNNSKKKILTLMRMFSAKYQFDIIDFQKGIPYLIALVS